MGVKAQAGRKARKLGLASMLFLSLAFFGCGGDDGCSAGNCDPCTRHEDCCLGRCAPAYENNVISPETNLGDFCQDDDPETICPWEPIVIESR